MLPRQLSFGPVGSQLEASAHPKAFSCFQEKSSQAIPQEHATGIAMSASYLQQSSPQAIPNQQSTGVPISASYRPLHTVVPSAAFTGLGFSPSAFLAPSVFQFR